MRFPLILAAWVGCALTLSATTTAADAPKKKIARCVRYTQEKGSDEQSVDVGLKNRCRYAVSCTVEWKVSCDDDSTETTPREQARTVSLERGAREIINASAAVCGNEGWAVDDIRWTCEPE